MEFAGDSLRFLVSYFINFVDDQEYLLTLHGREHFINASRYVVILYVHNKQQNICIGPSTIYCFHHRFLEFIFGINNSGGIQEYNLHILFGMDPNNLMTGGLRFMGSNGDFVTQQAVH